MKNFSSFRKVGLMLVAVLTTTGISPSYVYAHEHLSAVTQPSISAACLSDSQIDNFARIAPGITRGAQPSSKALTQMAKDGVKTIIDLRMNGSGTENEEAETTKLGMKYVHIPMMLMAPSSEQVSQFLSVVSAPANLPVFIHCRQGADRTGTLCGIYRRKMQGWNFDKTYAEMRDHHFKPFLLGMKDLVKNCPNQNFDVAPSSTPNTTAAATVEVPAPSVVAEQTAEEKAMIARLHQSDKVVAGDLPAAGTMMMTIEQ